MRKARLMEIFSAGMRKTFKDMDVLLEEALLGDQFSAYYLHMLASRSTRLLMDLGFKNPELLRPIAGKNILWPRSVANNASHAQETRIRPLVLLF